MFLPLRSAAEGPLPVQLGANPAARLAALVLAVAFGSVVPATAGRAAEPPLGAIVVPWAEGDYLSPVVCEVNGTPIRGARKFRIEAPERRGASWALHVHFEDLDAADATRCYDDLGRAQKNLVGTLDLVYRGTARPGMVLRDFRERLKRDRGFEFAIRGGALAVETVGAVEANGGGSGPGAVAPPPVFRGGTARLRLVRPGSDEDRLLSGLRSDRSVVLELEPRSGPELRIPAVRLRTGEAPSPGGRARR